MRFKSTGKMAGALFAAVALLALPGTIMAQSGNTVLKPADMQKLLPQTVYYHGQTATVQVRNSGGVKFADGSYVLIAMADTSGYSSDIASKYQAYFIVEAPIRIGGKTLPAGVYGAGFVGSEFVVTDVGAHNVLTVPLHTDAGMKRPTPLQVQAASGGGYRIYGGRKYVTFSR